MKIAAPLHSWEVSPAEAMRIQEELRGKVLLENELGEVRLVAGIDVSVKEDIAQAAVVVLSYPELEPVEQSLAQVAISFPYIPGLLAFREGPAVLAALEKLAIEPDLFIFDGQGLAHPRRLGIASHIGVILDRPSIGCAKSCLWGNYREPPPQAGARTYLHDKNEIIGAVVRTKDDVRPLFISIGHKVDLETAISYVLSCCRGHRLPETTRYAHRVAGGEKLKIIGSQLSLF